MKYVIQLTDKELTELYKIFVGKDVEIKSLNITKDEYGVALEGRITAPEWCKEILKEYPNATITYDDDYELTDYDVRVYHHSGNCTSEYRKWMYEKFGDEYARDYLLGV